MAPGAPAVALKTERRNQLVVSGAGPSAMPRTMPAAKASHSAMQRAMADYGPLNRTQPREHARSAP
jgi:hypothetical protein